MGLLRHCHFVFPKAMGLPTHFTSRGDGRGCRAIFFRPEIARGCMAISFLPTGIGVMQSFQFFVRWQGLRTPPPPCAGLRCSAARQYNELRMLAMTICLCRGGICELCIRCSWPPSRKHHLV